jgi:protein-S-isoprenylcysteine O-methyltransferase Ste14
MLLFRLIARSLVSMATLGALLFLPAGTWQWPRAWVFLGVLLIGAAGTLLVLLPDNSELLKERLKPPIQKGQPCADKIAVAVLIGTYIGATVLIPVDVFHLHLLPLPGAAVSFFGLILFIAGWWIAVLSMKANPFASTAVKLQTERRHVVAGRGVYQIVRHPMYAGASLFMIGAGLWLESYAAALAALAPVAAFAIRITVEERFLRRELVGYTEYTRSVRYRLIPYVW